VEFRLACIDGLPDVEILHPIQPHLLQPANLWKAAVIAEKKKIIEDRTRHLPTTNKIK